MKNKGESGQTSVEYIFLIVVVAAMMVAVLPIVRNFFLGEDGRCRPGSDAFICKVRNQLIPQDFRRFRLFGR